MLGQSEAAGYTYDGNGQHKYIYDLSPSLLLTCRQMDVEAADVLYGCNTYYLYCLPESMSSKYFHPCCPILRYQHIHSMPPINEYKAVAKVRHWKILVSTYSSEPWNSNQALIEASRLMHTSRPQSANILVIPQGVEAMPVLEPPEQGYQNTNELLRPLNLVRFTKGFFAISDASFDEIDTCIQDF
jgi:hypothetical protein